MEALFLLCDPRQVTPPIWASFPASEKWSEEATEEVRTRREGAGADPDPEEAARSERPPAARIPSGQDKDPRFPGPLGPQKAL